MMGSEADGAALIVALAVTVHLAPLAVWLGFGWVKEQMSG